MNDIFYFSCVQYVFLDPKRLFFNQIWCMYVIKMVVINFFPGIKKVGDIKLTYTNQQWGSFSCMY